VDHGLRTARIHHRLACTPWILTGRCTSLLDRGRSLESRLPESPGPLPSIDTPSGARAARTPNTPTLTVEKPPADLEGWWYWPPSSVDRGPEGRVPPPPCGANGRSSGNLRRWSTGVGPSPSIMALHSKKLFFSKKNLNVCWTRDVLNLKIHI